MVELVVSEEDKEYFGASIKRMTNDGTEYYSSREVANFLGYTRWGDFEKIIHRAMKACENAGMPVQDHFVEIGKIAEIGYLSTTSRTIKDVLLSRTAFLLIVQNAHPEKIMVSYGKAYIAKCVADEVTKAVQNRRKDKSVQLGEQQAIR